MAGLNGQQVAPTATALGKSSPGVGTAEITAGPRDKRGERLVMVVLGGTSHRDTLDTNKQASRRKFCQGIVENHGLPDSAIGELDQRILLAADEAEEFALEILAADESEQAGAATSQATQLVAMASDVELFHTPDEKAYAKFQERDHWEIHPLRFKAFRNLLARRYHERTGRAPGSQALTDAIAVLEGRACFDGEEHEVYLRLAEYEGKIYLDLCNDRWQVVEISDGGWRVLDESPVYFRRARGMLPLPTPVRGGTLEELWRFINVADEDRPLILGCLVGAMQPGGPFPVVILHGEQGSAKSTTARNLRTSIDPNKAALRSQPRNERDLVISANNAWVVSMDNISWLSQEMSDALCRLATGGGFATRELFSDADEALFHATRPVIMNGIEEIATRSDLLDRAVLLHLPDISPERRRPQRELDAEFREAHPRILGALLDAVAMAVRNLPEVALSEYPRMADFVRFVVAAEPALGLRPGDFMAAYTANRSLTNAIPLEASTVAQRLRQVSLGFPPGDDRVPRWTGTATGLLKLLENGLDYADRRRKDWPGSPSALSNRLRRLKTNLRAIGLDVLFDDECNLRARRGIEIRVTNRDALESGLSGAIPDDQDAGDDDLVEDSDSSAGGDD